MRKNSNYIISVIPLLKIPLSREQFFYYLNNKKISRGSLVEIPFGKRKIKGVVIESKKDFPRLGNIKLKKIKKIIEDKFLSEKQIKLAQFISDYYICSSGIILKNFIPKQVKFSPRITASVSTSSIQKIKLTVAQRSIIKTITKKQPASLLNKNFLLFGDASSGKTQIYFEVIKKIIKSKNYQALILLPELTGIAQEVERYGQEFDKKDIAILHSKISKGQFYKYWKDIKSGKIKIIIGTRQAVFAPFKNLKVIIIDEEHDISHKQWDMTPRYDARTVAEEMAEIYNAKIIFGSATPRIEKYYQAKNKKMALLRLPKLSTLNLNSQITITDLRKEHWHNWKKVKTVSPISTELKAEMAYNLKYNRQIVLFINRQGMSSFSVCVACKEVLKCPDCERALTYRKKGNYECLHCKFEAGDFPLCPNCQGMIFKNIGLGTEKIETEVEKLFPSAKIARADSSSMRTIRAQEKLWQDFSRKKIDILIGTQMIAKSWDLPNIGLVGIIDADSLFNFPDFYTDEIAFSLITQTIGRINRPQSKFAGTAIIQTYHPENQIIKWATEKKYQELYQHEIKQRRALKYPPFTHIIKLLFQDYDKKSVEQEAEKVYKKIISDIKQSSTLQVYPPQEPLTPKIRGRYRQQIIIKTKNYPGIPKKLLSNIQNLKSGWLVDVNPVNIV
ncbi:MAG TPA: primosomal protein N' [Candidatus Moranbacteria bacterium]|nr:primosomal protein N' [Candidatus Moranbacteria bacterium]